METRPVQKLNKQADENAVLDLQESFLNGPQLKKREQGQEQNFNKSAKELEPLSKGDVIRMKPFGEGKRERR